MNQEGAGAGGEEVQQESGSREGHIVKGKLHGFNTQDILGAGYYANENIS